RVRALFSPGHIWETPGERCDDSDPLLEHGPVKTEWRQCRLTSITEDGRWNSSLELRREKRHRRTAGGEALHKQEASAFSITALRDWIICKGKTQTQGYT
ncbi:unnamed protein product, partial [Gulo gulo]